MKSHVSDSDGEEHTWRSDAVVRDRGALDAVRDIVLILDAGGSVVHANFAAVEAYGYPRDELLSLSIRDLRAHDTLADISQQMRSAAHGGVTFETLHLRGDGSSFPVEVSSSAIALETGDGVISVIRDITARKESEVLLARLVEQLSETNERLDGAVTLLSSTVGASDLETLLTNTVTAISQVMSTDAALFLVDERNVMRVRAQYGAERWAPVGSSVNAGEGFCGRVVEAAVPLYVADISVSSATLPDHVLAGLRSMFGVPVYVDGTLFGVLECAWTEERIVDEAEAAMVRLGAERIALAIGQARLYEQSRTSARYAAALNEINSLLGASFELDPVIDDVLRLATEVLGADAGMLARSSSDGWCVEHAVGLGPEGPLVCTIAGSTERVPVAEELLTEVDSGLADWAHRSFGLHTTVDAPVLVRRAADAVLVFGRNADEPTFDDLAADFVRRAAQSLTLALTNVAHFEAEHHIAETLQEALLLMPPSVSGIDFSHMYRSATLATRVGGDFFDVFEMAGERVGILVGDVSGKGLEAAVLTSIIKDTIRAYAHETPSPADAIAKANIALGEAAKLPDFASVFFAVIETGSGVMTYCNAGHPPAAVIAPDSGVRLLEGNSAVIGAFPDLHYTDTSLTLLPEESVLLYTDGVTEARDASGRFFGDEGLLAALDAAGPLDVAALPAAAFQAVLTFSEGRLTDDIALLAFRLARVAEAPRRGALD